VALTVVQVLPALEVGGVERGTVEVAEALVRHGHRALVVSAPGRLVTELQRAGAEHVAWPIGAKHPGTLRFVRPLRRLLREHGASVVHARSRLPAWIAHLALVGIPAPERPAFVTTVHGPYTVNRYSAIMTRGARVIAISEFIRRYVLANYPQVDPGRVQVIHRGIAPGRFPHGYRPPAQWLQQWRATTPVRGRFLVTLPARITRWKGQTDFVTLVGILKARGIPVLGLAVGGAEPRRARFRREIEAAAARQGLAGDLLLLGDRPDLREILAVSDAAVSLARVPEAFGRTTLEALSLGTPVVGYAHGGTAEILQALYPRGLCPVGDVQAVAARLEQLYRAPERVPEHRQFTLEQMLAGTLEIYARVAARPA